MALLYVRVWAGPAKSYASYANEMVTVRVDSNLPAGYSMHLSIVSRIVKFWEMGKMISVLVNKEI